jgi:hypothetical protein
MEPSYRAEITLSESSYRGDRDERLTIFTLAGEGETEQEALVKVFRQMSALRCDCDPEVILSEWRRRQDV